MSVELNLYILEKVKEVFTSDIAIEVIDEIENYGDNWHTHLKDIVNHGCASGTVGSLIYYSDTFKFHDDYESTINEIIQNYLDGTGLSFADIVGDKFDLYDIDQLKNFKSWFAFEDVACRIYDYIEENFEV